MKSKILVFIFIGIFLISFTSAVISDLGSFQKGTAISLPQVANATACNITSVRNPNSTVLIEDVVMTKRGTEFNYTLTASYTTTLGTYKVNGECDQTVWVYEFEVTPNGSTITPEKVYIYIISLIFLVVLIVGTVLIIYQLPSSDAQDVIGNIVQVSWLKYLRPVLWMFNWGIALSIVFIISNLTLIYLQYEMVGKLFFAVYQIMFYTMIVAVPITFIWILVRIFQDKEMKRMISRGVEIKGTP